MPSRITHRREQILAEAHTLACDGKLYTLTMQDVADACGCSRTLVYNYYRNTDELQLAIIMRAILEGSETIFQQMRDTHDPRCNLIPPGK